MKNDEPKRIARLLQMIRLLKTGRYSNIVEISDRLGVAKRTGYRYLQTLSQAGINYHIDEFTGRYYVREGEIPVPDMEAGEILALAQLTEQMSSQLESSSPGSLLIVDLIEKILSEMQDDHRALFSLGTTFGKVNILALDQKEWTLLVTASRNVVANQQCVVTMANCGTIHKGTIQHIVLEPDKKVLCMSCWDDDREIQFEDVESIQDWSCPTSPIDVQTVNRAKIRSGT